MQLGAIQLLLAHGASATARTRTAQRTPLELLPPRARPPRATSSAYVVLQKAAQAEEEARETAAKAEMVRKKTAEARARQAARFAAAEL